jgi:hypothetical protein
VLVNNGADAAIASGVILSFLSLSVSTLLLIGVDRGVGGITVAVVFDGRNIIGTCDTGIGVDKAGSVCKLGIIILADIGWGICCCIEYFAD